VHPGGARISVVSAEFIQGPLHAQMIPDETHYVANENSKIRGRMNWLRSKNKIPAGVVCLIFYLWLSCCVALAHSGAPRPRDEYSGMYSFRQDGEFVQITIEDQGRVTGFVSRYGDEESDRGAFLDQFFKQGKLDGRRLSFTTQTVHGVWFEFNGAFERGEGKAPGDESYYLLKGTLIESTIDGEKKTSSKSREVTFRSFPKGAAAMPGKRD
jgi:hypothetical protein